MEEHPLSLHVLGEMRIDRNDQTLHFRGQAEAALLVYLAHTGRTHSREALADLLWEARTTGQSLSNLRTVLARLRPLAGDVLVITRKTLAYEPAARRQVDSVRLQQRLGTLRDIATIADAARLREALRLYQGDFLAGFYLPNAPRFNDWVVVTQEQLRQALFAGYQRLLEFALAQGDLELGIETATRWLAWDELNEGTHQHLIRLLAQSGRSAAAIAQYEQCRAILAAELGVAPHQATTRLVDQIRQGAFEVTAADLSTGRRVDHNLPRELTPFIGREAEIEALTQRIRDPAYPLITLTGEGGIGKTRLALAAARHLLEEDHSFADGMWFVALAGIRAPGERSDPGAVREAVATAAGNAMQLVFHGRRTPSRQLLAFLKERAVLLILDNFEPLLESDAVDLLLALLQEAPRAQMLVTSRAALDLNSEWVVRVDGLPVPEEVKPAAEGSPGRLPLPSDAKHYDSVRLFAERAVRQAPDFRLAEQLAEVSAICRLAAGLPLAIELAAASTRRLSCAQIVAALRASVDLLATSRRDVPARQRSMRAIFEYSWQLLDEEEQRILAQLSVFRGSFDLEAACAVMLEPAWRLDSLERHSLLRQDELGHYQLHPLLSEYAADKLAGLATVPQLAGATQRHSEYYLKAVSQLVPAGPHTPKQLATLQVELGNIRRAWRWAAERPDRTALEAGYQGLAAFYFRQALFQEGEEALAGCIAWLREAPPAAGDDLLLVAKLEGARTAFLNALNRYHEAIGLAQAILNQVLERRNADDVKPVLLAQLQATAELAWGTALYRQGEFEQALGHLTAALAAARRAGASADEAASHRRLGTTLLERGEFDGAHAHFQAALAIFRANGDRMGEGSILNDLGWLAQREGRLDKALAYDRQAYDVQLAIDNRHGASMALINMAGVLEMQGDFSEAYASRQQVLRFLRDIDDRYHRTLVYHDLGVHLSRVGDDRAAHIYYERSLAIDRDLGDAAGVAWTLLNLGLLYNHRGDFATALSLHQESLAISQTLGARTSEGLAQLRIGQDYYGLGQLDEAEAAARQALAILLALQQTVWAMETRGLLARILLDLGRAQSALDCVEEVLAFLAEHSLAGAREPLLAYWNCYIVLRSLADARAPGLLKSAYAQMQQQAARIGDVAQRHSYLTNIDSHRTIMQEMG